jgi:hypothetical protein
MEVLQQDLEAPTSSLANGNVETNGDKSTLQQEWNLMKMRNAIMVVSRIPLEPISLRRKNLLFEKLLELDRTLVSGKLDLSLKTLDRIGLLVVLRRTLNRFVGVIARDAVEVIDSSDNFSFTGYSACR